MKRLILASIALVLITSFAKAQEVTDELVWKYALMTEVVDQMKADLSRVVNETIQKQEGMTGQRYNELAGGATAANEFETKFMASIKKIKDRRLKAIKSVNSNLATKMLGSVDNYNAVKAAVEGDKKAKYDEYKAQIAFGASS
ncbi:MAG: hypothetical protein RIM99_00955 [Cyclobacteriaceae bacterium]